MGHSRTGVGNLTSNRFDPRTVQSSECQTVAASTDQQQYGLPSAGGTFGYCSATSDILCTAAVLSSVGYDILLALQGKFRLYRAVTVSSAQERRYSVLNGQGKLETAEYADRQNVS